MASTDKYPVPAYNYAVVIGGAPAVSFSEVSGLQVEYETVVYRDGRSFKTGVELLQGQRKVSRVTLKRGVTANRVNLQSWMDDRQKHNVYIKLKNASGSTIVQWELIDAIAVKIDMHDFAAANNNVAIETLELMVYDIRIKYL
jgi:phage tail-like protein